MDARDFITGKSYPKETFFYDSDNHDGIIIGAVWFFAPRERNDAISAILPSYKVALHALVLSITEKFINLPKTRIGTRADVPHLDISLSPVNLIRYK